MKEIKEFKTAIYLIEEFYLNVKNKAELNEDIRDIDSEHDDGMEKLSDVLEIAKYIVDNEIRLKKNTNQLIKQAILIQQLRKEQNETK